MGAIVSTDTIRLVISDATRMGCELLGQAIDKSGHDFEVVAFAEHSKELIQLTAEHLPDVVLVSAQLQDGPNAGLLALSQIHTHHPEVVPVFVMNSRDSTLAVNALCAGAKGVFYRVEPFEVLCKCIRSVHDGQVWSASTEMRQLLDAMSAVVRIPLVSATGVELLTRRQEQLAQMVSEGMTNREIAKRLHLSEHTVKNYMYRIFDKLGVSNRSELIIYTLNQQKRAS